MATRPCFEAATFSASPGSGTVSAVVADDQRDHVVEALLRAERGHGVEECLRPLQRLETPGEQQDAVAAEAELVTKGDRVLGVQDAQVHARLGDADAGARGAVEPHQVLGLRDAPAHQPVGGGHQASLGCRAPGVHWQPGPRLGARQRVEGLHPWDSPQLAQLLGHQAPEPVVSVNDHVLAPLTGGVGGDGSAECIDVADQVLLGQRSGRPHRQPDQPAHGRDHLFGGRPRVIAAHEDIGGDARLRQSLAQSADSEVAAPVLATAQRCQRRGVHADDRNRTGHGA